MSTASASQHSPDHELAYARSQAPTPPATSRFIRVLHPRAGRKRALAGACQRLAWCESEWLLRVQAGGRSQRSRDPPRRGNGARVRPPDGAPGRGPKPPCFRRYGRPPTPGRSTSDRRSDGQLDQRREHVRNGVTPAVHIRFRRSLERLSSAFYEPRLLRQWPLAAPRPPAPPRALATALARARTREPARPAALSPTCSRTNIDIAAPAAAECHHQRSRQNGATIAARRAPSWRQHAASEGSTAARRRRSA